MTHKHRQMNASRQASLPAPNPGLPADGFPACHTGRVTYVNHEAGTVDVWLDSGAVIADVPVMCRSSGPDRADDDLPPPRTAVVIMYAWGTKLKPIVVGVLPRGKEKAKKGPKKYGHVRRIYPNGAHWMMKNDGTFEARFADGSSLVVGDVDEPEENHTGQQRESLKGTPYEDPPLENQTKPGAYKLTLKMASGVTFSFDGKSWEVDGLDSAHIKSGSIKLQSGPSGIAIDGSGVAVVGPAFKWHATPLTVSAFSPAGMQVLVPLPGPSPFGLGL